MCFLYLNGATNWLRLEVRNLQLWIKLWRSRREVKGERFRTDYRIKQSAHYGDGFLKWSFPCQAKCTAGKPTLLNGFPRRHINPQNPSASRRKMLPMGGFKPGSLTLWSRCLSDGAIIAFGSLSISYGFIARLLALDFGLRWCGLWLWLSLHGESFVF